MIRPVGVLLVLALVAVAPWSASATERNDDGTIEVVPVDGERLSIRATEAPVRDVLTAIASEMRLDLSIQGQDDRSVTLHMERVSLREALDRIVQGGYALAGQRLLVFPGPGRGTAPPPTEGTPPLGAEPPAAEPPAPTPVPAQPLPSPPAQEAEPRKEQPAPGQPPAETDPQPPRPLQ